MSYKPDNDELFFCGNCKRAQEPSKGEKCIVCSKITVSWHQNRESESDVIKKWKQVNGQTSEGTSNFLTLI